MGLSLEQKQATVADVQTRLAGAQTVIVAEYRGLNVDRVTQLRSKARQSGVYLRVDDDEYAAASLRDAVASYRARGLEFGLHTVCGRT